MSVQEPSAGGGSASAGMNNVNHQMDQRIEDEENAPYDPSIDLATLKVKAIEAKSLECPELAKNLMYEKLKDYVIKFFEDIEEHKDNPEFAQMKFVYTKLRNLVREIVRADTAHMQQVFLSRVYRWFMHKLDGMQGRSEDEKQDEKEMFNPQAVEKARLNKETLDKQKLNLLKNEEIQGKVDRERYTKEQRTLHPDIPPCKDRIGSYKRRVFNIPDESRPESATTAVTSKKGGPDTFADEGNTSRYPFTQFFTDGEPVEFPKQNRFDGKSNYYNYVPTNMIVEQQMEQVWFERANREVQEKRRDEELKVTMKEWSDAKSRYSQEISRKHEHLNYGSNFKEARGYVRQNDKTKNYDWKNQEVLDEEDSFSESELEEEEEEEAEEGEEGEEPTHKHDKESSIVKKGEKPQPAFFDITNQEFDMIDEEKAEEEAERLAKEAEKASPTKKGAEDKENKPEVKKSMLFHKVDHNDTKGDGKIKIATVRKFQGHLINATENKMDPQMINNVFISNKDDAVTLSCYNKPDQYGQKSLRPKSAANLFTQHPLSISKRPTTAVAPPKKKGPPLHPIFAYQLKEKDGPIGIDESEQKAQFKSEQLREVEQIKQRLAQDDVNCNVHILAKAVLMPDEMEFDRKERKYPNPGMGLFHNPFPKKKKKGKKKKGKKKKKK